LQNLFQNHIVVPQSSDKNFTKNKNILLYLKSGAVRLQYIFKIKSYKKGGLMI
tara:strand:- start:36 stop:194 length:159 start_codon:yes stop_codon:yes gene_type:complete